MEEFLKNNATAIACGVHQQTRTIINNVLKSFYELKDDPPKLHKVNFNKPYKLTSLVCGVSLKNVKNVRKKFNDVVTKNDLEPERKISDMDKFFKNITYISDSNFESQSVTVIKNVLKFFIILKKDADKLKAVNFQKPRDLTALVCGVSLRTVDRIKKKCQPPPNAGQSSVTKPSPKPKRLPCPVTNIDEQYKNIIKEVIATFMASGQRPTLLKIIDATKKRIIGFKCGKTSMSRILKEMGYEFKASNPKKSRLCRVEPKKVADPSKVWANSIDKDSIPSGDVQSEQLTLQHDGLLNESYAIKCEPLDYDSMSIEQCEPLEEDDMNSEGCQIKIEPMEADWDGQAVIDLSKRPDLSPNNDKVDVQKIVREAQDLEDEDLRRAHLSDLFEINVVEDAKDLIT